MNNIMRCDSCDRVIEYNEDNWQQMVFDNYLPGQFIDDGRAPAITFCHDCMVSFIDIFELRHKITKKHHLCRGETPCCEFGYKYASDGFVLIPSKTNDYWTLDPELITW